MDNIETIITPTIYCILTPIGTIGNLLVLFSLVTAKEGLKTANDVYLVNLSLADLVFVMTLPFWAYDLFTGNWIFGVFGCKIISAISYINMYGSIFFLTTMSIDRRRAVVSAVKSMESRTPRKAWVNSAIVWIISIISAILPLTFRNVWDDEYGSICVWDFPQGYQLPVNVAYSMSRTLFGFLIPLAIICACYGNILVFMRNRNRPRQKNFKQIARVTRMVAIIIIGFVVTWLPNQITNVIQLLRMTNLIALCPRPSQNSTGYAVDDSANYTTSLMYTTTVTSQLYEDFSTTMPGVYEPEPSCFRNIRHIHLITVCLGFSNSVINPFIYASFANVMRSYCPKIHSLKQARYMQRSSHRRRSTKSSILVTFRSRMNSYSDEKALPSRQVQRLDVGGTEGLASPSTTRTEILSPETNKKLIPEPVCDSHGDKYPRDHILAEPADDETMCFMNAQDS